MKVNVCRVLLLLVCSTLTAQVQSSVPYKIRYQNFVKGDMMIIGNNIVNRSTRATSPNSPFDELGNTAKHNDEFYMKYIDIDNDSQTFSSSSAFLDLPQNTSKVIYAGLYWAGIYSYDEVISKKNNKFEIKQQSRESINNVLFKLPGKTTYESVLGKIIFDGKGQEEYENAAPYVVYADVTELVKSQKLAKGEYTLANVRATQGTVLGGVSAGWVLVVVYEQENASSKKIVTYDGFEGVHRGRVDIDFDDFLTPESGNIEVKLSGAALEGDHSMSGSSLQIESLTGKKVYLFNKRRPKRNFFNSTITSNDTSLGKRRPDSKNTLGFDIFNIDIPNENNEVIENNATKLKASMFAKEDRYYSFLTALSVNSNIVFQKKNNTEVILNDSIKNQNIITQEKVNKEESKKVVNSQDNKDAKEKEEDDLAEIISTEIPSGYYNIVGVFYNSSYKNRYLRTIKKMGLFPNFFYNSKNNFYYVYVYHTYSLLKSKKNKNYLKEKGLLDKVWILHVKNR